MTAWQPGLREVYGGKISVFGEVFRPWADHVRMGGVTLPRPRA